MALFLFRAVLTLALLMVPVSCRKAQSGLTGGGRDKGLVVKLHLDRTVDKIERISSSYVSPSNQSMSPWVYREQCVPSRVPRCLHHAHCLTSGCLHPLSGREDLSLEARPIYYQLLVLHRVPRRRDKASRSRTSRRGKNKGKRYDLRLGSEVVSVGCTCVRPSIITPA